MKVSIFGLLFASLFVFTACDKQMGAEIMNDQLLIESIRDAQNKQTLSTADLPTVSYAVVSTEFIEHAVSSVKLATALGYEVSMSDAGAESFNLYFDLAGKPLRSKEGGKKCGKKGKHDKKDKKGEPKPCFKIKGTVSFTMPDGSVISGESKEAIGSAVKAWYEANGDVKVRPVLNFPLTIVFADGKEVVLNNADDFKQAKSVCGDKKPERKPCFKPSGTVSFTMPDGSTVSGSSKEEIEQAMKAWHQANPGVTGRPVMQFPITVVYADGSEKSIASEEELKAAAKACGDSENEDDN